MKQATPFLPYAYMQGKVIPFEKATVSIATHALHYGTAAFGGMRVQPDTKNQNHMLLFRPDLHIKRLAYSAKILGFPFKTLDIEKALKTFISANPGDEAYYIRPLLYASDLGIAPRLHDIDSDLLIYGIKMGNYLTGSGISCCFSDWQRISLKAVPLGGKISGAYVNSALAKTEAHRRGFDEAVFLNDQGFVAEASAMNIFLVKDGALHTPLAEDDILAGITRSSIIELAKELGIPTKERHIKKEELIAADEVFLCGTAARITSVSKIEQHKLPATHPVTDQLLSTFSDVTKGTSSSHNDWMVSYPAKP